MNVGLRKLKFVDPQYVSTQKYNNRADPGDRVSEILQYRNGPSWVEEPFCLLLMVICRKGVFKNPTSD